MNFFRAINAFSVETAEALVEARHGLEAGGDAPAEALRKLLRLAETAHGVPAVWTAIHGLMARFAMSADTARGETMQ